MDFDFALLLVVLTAVSGVVWLLDRLFLAKARAQRAQAFESMAALSQEERDARSRNALREPVAVEYARSFFPVLFVILLFRSFIAEPFKIPSGSMMPTLLVGDFILVNKFAYGLRLPVLNKKVLDVGSPRRGDVFVFRYPENPKEDYIKRVIGLPGDEITYRNKVLYVNGQEIAETPLGPYVGPGESGRSMASAQVKLEKLGDVEHRIMEFPQAYIGHEGTWKVPPGHYFAMGDNRDNSQDSRFWGFVPEQNLVGRAFVIWMNLDNGIDFSRIGTLIK
ncbi:signal peptidase I [Dokdonella sp.]|uniref:signal peptidase I n=1 Tax=Dokdonella sp. TaxID=2291710 RepID=UPI001B18A075|nr:signal peptidase I [Dokdonella sp.]MBO9663477.1 signal peptidase I [Dokdonella sp.]